VRVASLVSALPAGEGGFAGEVSPRATVAEAAPRFGETGTRLLVRADDGTALGVLERERVAAMMMQG
jgi:hypothetical protein